MIGTKAWLDTTSLRAGVEDVLATDTPEKAFDVPTLQRLTETYREQIRALIPEVGAQAWRLPRDSRNRAAAMAGIAEAEIRLRLGDGDTLLIRATVTQKLARSVLCLCRHYDRMVPR